MHDSCRVKCGSLGVVCKVCMLPLQSGELNVTDRRVGANKSGGEQVICPSI